MTFQLRLIETLKHLIYLWNLNYNYNKIPVSSGEDQYKLKLKRKTEGYYIKSALNLSLQARITHQTYRKWHCIKM